MVNQHKVWMSGLQYLRYDMQYVRFQLHSATISEATELFLKKLVRVSDTCT